MDWSKKLYESKEIVWITWKDAVSDSTRLHIDSVSDCALVTNSNLGFIMHENDERVILVHGISTSGEVDYFAIPANCIIERVYLNQPRKGNSNAQKVSKRRRRSSG